MAEGLIIASTILSTVGALQQAGAQSAAAKRNAEVAAQNADLAVKQAAADEEKQRREARFRRGGARVAAGGSGLLSTDFGDIFEDNAITEELDALIIRNQGQLQSRAFTNEAALERSRASSARTAGFIGAGTSLLSGAAAFSQLPK